MKEGFLMALSDETLQEIVSNLTPEEREQLYAQLGLQITQDQKDIAEGRQPKSPITNPTTISSQPTKPIKYDNDIYCCLYCGSARLKPRGFTSAMNQIYYCRDCKKSFTENHGSALKWTHLSEETWKTVLSGIVNNHSLPVIARDTGLVQSTIWLCKQKVCNAISQMYGYGDLFNGISEADEFYCRASFKGKRDAEFFIYTLGRMPRHNRNREEKIYWLQKNNLYDRLRSEDPAYLEELLEDEKKKRGISNDQICILTLVDENGNLYLEPVSVGRLEKAMAKAKLKQKFTGSGNVLVTDDHNAYDKALYGTGVKHEKVNSKVHKKGKYSLAKVNSVHSELSSFMSSLNGKVFNTKYLDLTLTLFWWLYKHKEYNTEEKVNVLFKILKDDITDLEAKERVDLITSKELSEREITIDTKGQFPTKI